MDLKKHNDIVHKLLEKVEEKENQIKSLRKELTKVEKQLISLSNGKSTSTHSSTGSSKFPVSTEVQKQIQKRVAQLNKEHNSKIAQLNQQLKSKSIENKELKERIQLKEKLDSKEKEHIVEVMKRNFDRKPGTPYDHKISALIAHHDEQIEKKDKHIETLKRQLEALSLKKGLKQNRNDESGREETTTQSDGLKFQEDGSAPQVKTRGISLIEHKAELRKLEKINEGQRRLIDQKSDQLREIKKQYNELTKEYYRIVNDYGVADSNCRANMAASSNKKRSTNNMSNSSVSNDNLLQKLAEQQDTNGSITVDFEEKFKRFSNRPKVASEAYGNILQQQEEQDSQEDYDNEEDIDDQNPRKFTSKPTKHQSQGETSAALKEQIAEIFSLEGTDGIVPFLTNLSIRTSEFELYDAIIRKFHGFFYKFGMGKVSKTDMMECIEAFEQKVHKWIQNSDLLDELCIEAGAKRNKLLEKVIELKQINTEYLSKLRNIEFLNELNKAQKVVEFIDFFQLQKSDLKLPVQLRNIYEQLKYVDKFIKEVNLIMDGEAAGGKTIKDSKSLEETLECVIRKLERYEMVEGELERIKALKEAKREKKRIQQQGSSVASNKEN